MMRALALGILLVVNLVLLFWQVMVHKPEASVSVAEPDVGELRLLSELQLAAVAPPPAPGALETISPGEPPGAAEQASVAQVAPGAIPIEPAQTEPESGSQTGSETGPEPVAVAGSLLGSEADSTQDDPEVPAAVSPGEAPEAVVDAKVPAATGQDVTQTPAQVIEESEPVEQSVAAVGQPRPDRELEPATPARQCWRLGPFDNAAEAVRLAQALPPGVNRLSVEEATVSVPRGYYVLIPPLASRAQALRLERELKEAGIEDSWVFIAGPLRNAVSLGLFNREINAQRRLRRVQSKGFEPELRVRYRDAEKTVLLVEGAADDAVREALQALDAENIEAVGCPE